MYQIFPLLKICSMGLYTELFYAIIPTLLSCFFADLLSLHLVTCLTFLVLFMSLFFLKQVHA